MGYDVFLKVPRASKKSQKSLATCKLKRIMRIYIYIIIIYIYIDRNAKKCGVFQTAKKIMDMPSVLLQSVLRKEQL